MKSRFRKRGWGAGEEEPWEIEGEEEEEGDGVDFGTIQPEIFAEKVERRGLGGGKAEEGVISVGQSVDGECGE